MLRSTAALLDGHDAALTITRHPQITGGSRDVKLTA
jgi:hypothetical protein